MKLKRKSAIFLGLSLVLMSYSNASALTGEELNDYVLSSYGERYQSSDRLEAYLKANGVDMKEYKQYLKELNKYNTSTEYVWEKVENGSLLIDEILFSDKNVRKEYDKALKLLGSDKLAYDFVRRNMINNPNKFITKFESDMKNLEKIGMAIEDKFNRKLTDWEKLWLTDIRTMKHALYAATSGGILIPPDDVVNMDNLLDLIIEGEGYKVIGLSDENIKKYREFIKIRSKYDSLMISYVKKYSMFESIYTEILNKYNKDIFKELTDVERLNIYNSSLDGFIFNELEAKEKILKALISKGKLTKEEIENADKNESVSSNNDGNYVNPWAELSNHLKNNSSSIENVQSLSSLYDGKGLSVIFEDMLEKFIYCKYKDKDINTYLRVSKENVVSGPMLGELLDALDTELSLKRVFSKKEMLTFFENKINVFKWQLDEEKGIAFDKIASIFKELGISLYLKDIDYEEDSSVNDDTSTETEVQGNSSESYSMKLNFEDKMAIFDLGETQAIQFEDIDEILGVFDAKCIMAQESILVYKENQIKISNSFGLKDKEISVDKFKKLLNDMGIKVNIKVTKEIV